MWIATLLACGGPPVPELEPLALVPAENGVRVPLERFACGDGHAVVELGAWHRVSGQPVWPVDLSGCEALLVAASPETELARVLHAVSRFPGEVWLQVDDPSPSEGAPVAGETGRTDVTLGLEGLPSAPAASVRLDLGGARTTEELVVAVDALVGLGHGCIDAHGVRPPTAPRVPLGVPRPLDPASSVAALPVHLGIGRVALDDTFRAGDATCTVQASEAERQAVAARQRADQVLGQSKLLMKIIGTMGASPGGPVDLWSDEDQGLGDIDAALMGDWQPPPSEPGEAVDLGGAAGIGDLDGAGL